MIHRLDHGIEGGPGSKAGTSIGGSVAAAPVGAGPDQREGVAVFIVEEIGVDRSVEARIVELEPEVVAAFAGALGPGGTDLGVMWSTT